MDVEFEIKKFLEIVPHEVTHTRFDHSLHVAELAEKFSFINRYPNPRKAYLAGILHDITKQKPKEFHREIFHKHNFSYKDIPEPAYHPFSAVFYLRDKYQFEDEEILSAVKNHTLGSENLSLLDEILYVSDFLGSDYARRQKDYEKWIFESEKNLSFGVLLKSAKVIEELIEKRFFIHPLTLSMYNKYLNIS